MEIKKGIAVSPGVAIGPALVLESEDVRIPQRRIRPEQVAEELTRLSRAIDSAETESRQLQESTRAEVGDAVAGLFAAQSLMFRDPALQRELTSLISEQHRTAEYAVSVAMNQFVRRLSSKGRWAAERVADLRDAERRLLHHLIGERRESLTSLSEEVVVIAHDLTPSQTASMSRNMVRGFATDAGGSTSHVAILARALGMPAVVGLKNISLEVSGGDTVIIDGYQGLVIIRPDRETRERYRETEKRVRRLDAELAGLASLPAQTRDGVDVQLLGNIEFPHEVETAIRNGAAGIGLYRTEFLYLGAAAAPTEEDHFRAYTAVVAGLAGRPVIIRTLDLGADKYSEHLATDHANSSTALAYSQERNPFLGVRSIRLCLQHLDMFRTQLRAILRASARGSLKLMFPLVSTLQELRQAKALLGEVMADLDHEGVAYDRNIPVGMMVEIPAAAYALQDFCPEVAFISVGTNDLIQYMLAVDRGNERVAHLFSPANPAVLRMLRQVVATANAAKVEVSLCGEMAGDPDFVPLLVGMGFRILSVTSPVLPEVKRVIRAVSAEQCLELAERVLKLSTDREILGVLREFRRKLLPDESSEC